VAWFLLDAYSYKWLIDRCLGARFPESSSALVLTDSAVKRCCNRIIRAIQKSIGFGSRVGVYRVDPDATALRRSDER